MKNGFVSSQIFVMILPSKNSLRAKNTFCVVKNQFLIFPKVFRKLLFFLGVMSSKIMRSKIFPKF